MRGSASLRPQDWEDDTHLEAVDAYNVGTPNLSAAVRRAIIVEMSQGEAAPIIAARYDVSPSTVRRIWKVFEDSTSDVRRLGDENPEIFVKRVEAMAANAIEAGLLCDRDPYRQAGVGIACLKGTGRFKSDSGSGGQVQVNVLINSMPENWKSRYIGG